MSRVSKMCKVCLFTEGKSHFRRKVKMNNGIFLGFLRREVNRQQTSWKIMMGDEAGMLD